MPPNEQPDFIPADQFTPDSPMATRSVATPPIAPDFIPAEHFQPDPTPPAASSWINPASSFGANPSQPTDIDPSRLLPDETPIQLAHGIAIPRHLYENIKHFANSLLGDHVPPEAKKDQGFTKNVVDNFTHPDQEARGMSQSLGYIPGLATNTVLEGIKRLTSKGKTGEGSEEWAHALEGNATSAPEQLQGMGMGKLASYAAGLPLGIAADVATGGGNFFGGALSDLKPAPGIIGSLLQVPTEGTEAAGPLATGARKLGEKIYKAPWAPVEAELMDYRGATPSGAYGDFLWNKGRQRVGGASKTNPALEDQLKGLKGKEWDAMETGLDAATDAYDLSPATTSSKHAAGQKAVDDHMAAQQKPVFVEAAKNYAKERGYDLNNLSDEQMEEIAAAGNAALNHFNTHFPGSQQAMRVERAGQDAAIGKWKANIKEALNGESNRRDDAIEVLKQVIPDFAPLIEENATRFRTGEPTAAKAFFNELVDNAFEGPRSIKELHRLGSNFGKEAAGSMPMKSSVYQVGGKVTAPKINDAGSQKVLSQLVEDQIRKQAGPQVLSKFQTAKQNYGLLARGEETAINVARNAEKTPILSKLEAMALAGAVHNPGYLMPAGAGITQRLLTRNPRVATGAGIGLNNLGQSGLWDTALRGAAVNGLKQ